MVRKVTTKMKAKPQAKRAVKEKKLAPKKIKAQKTRLVAVELAKLKKTYMTLNKQLLTHKNSLRVAKKEIERMQAIKTLSAVQSKALNSAIAKYEKKVKTKESIEEKRLEYLIKYKNALDSAGLVSAKSPPAKRRAVKGAVKKSSISNAAAKAAIKAVALKNQKGKPA